MPSGETTSSAARSRWGPLFAHAQAWRSRAARHPGLVHHGIAGLVYILTRSLLYAAGLRFELVLSWMFMSDIGALKARPLETLFYFHAFAPGMNMLTAWLLWLLPEQRLAAGALGVFYVSGLVLCLSLFELLKSAGASPRFALIVAMVFSLLPQTLYFENLYLYTYPCAALSCAAAVFFLRGLARGSTPAWLGCFACCAALGYLYTAFHLFWVALVAGAGLLLSPSGAKRSVLQGMTPALLLLALYAKNYAVFGVFGATSWGGANIALATTSQMSKPLRERWIREGKLSPYAAINVYSGPAAYLRFPPADRRYPWPGTNELERPSVGAPNFNHGLFIEVNRQRRQDASQFIAARPREYLDRVLHQNLPALFGSTTHWHPHDRRAASPHHRHRQVLGAYERLYDELVHSWPLRGPGLYVFLPVFWLWGAWRSARGLFSRSASSSSRLEAAALGLCLFQIAFIVSASSLFTAFESSRYRYGAEPFIWVLVAAALANAWAFARTHVRSWRARRA